VATVGLVEPADALRLLSAERHVPGKHARVSVLHTYPSYLGELVECGLRLGYRPQDFGLRQINCGGELLTTGLKTRAQDLFGLAQCTEGYGLTEAWPFSGLHCTAGHLHFQPTHGLLEVQQIDDDRPAPPGEAGRLVLTPFPPFRETTILLRYDTEDLVRPLAGPLTCEHRHLPATTRLLGKRRLSVHDGDGWTFPRDVVEALETLPEVPLPARYGFWAVPGGVAVEIVTRADTVQTRRVVEQSLVEHGVPLQALQLHADRSTLRRPFPLRGDLRERAFGTIETAAGVI
jgi:acyl-CoA synthetase (AMP-forming)/AMP-acid ligase II